MVLLTGAQAAGSAAVRERRPAYPGTGARLPARAPGRLPGLPRPAVPRESRGAHR
jgi:hypothetical protein